MALPDRLAAALADRYRIEREIGSGGMATVYLAEDLKHDRQVALKVLRPELGAVLGSDRFLAEIKITARLDHPHILTLIDSGASEGFLYYVLPLVRGESLRDKLTRERQLDLDEALAITKAVASALDYAHRQGVVHRDIKPENILLQEGEAMLTDFGIALAVKEAGGSRLTETGLSLGTPQYMSPEQATGDRTLDARSDVYSLGAVLYEMLVGEPPVTGPNAQAMIAKLMTERPTRVRVVRDTVPEGVDNAIAKALSKVPADRFASASEFARVLAQPVAASSAAPAGRPRWLKAAVAGAAVVTLGAVAWMAFHSRAPSPTSFTPQFEQLTTDGNARGPALSPDGTRLAFVARDCDERARCTDRLLVRDIGGAGSMTVLRGSRIRFAQWAANGRFLVAARTEPGEPTGIVAVSALGGTLWSLPGWAPGVLGGTDTLLVSPGFLSRDTVSWLQLVTVSDGVVQDSIATRAPAFFQFGIPAPVGGRIALVSATESGTVIRLLDRAGRMTDSLPPSATIRVVRWTPRADALLLQVELGEGRPLFGGPSAPAPSIVVRRDVSPDGKFVGAIDTLLKLPAGSEFAEIRADGSALLSQGTVEAVVYALERSDPNRTDFRSRRLVSSTAGLQAEISRDGATVWLKRGGSAGTLRRDAFLPFDGGSERSFNLPPGDELGADWTRPRSDGLLYPFRDSSGRARLIHVNVSTGQSRELGDLPVGTQWVFTVPGGGYGIPDLEAHSARIVGRPGRSDTTWMVPGIAGRQLTVPGGVASDGTAFIEYSPSRRNDTLWVRRVALDGEVTTPAVPIVFDGTWLNVFADGSAEFFLRDSIGGLGWYRISPGDTRSVRLGDAPIQGAATTWTASDDGRRFIVVEPVDRPDIFLLRNFGELLER